ncbi:MAG: Ribosomal RNA small subunit methyltransferase B [Smithella sp. PtaU1.Bin162]|nr:MAG: Ribosomal RNA small subunit methyltransferase B [Smithella sp. PtaU1.Bin162]
MKKSIRRLAVDILDQVHLSKDFAGNLLDECLDFNNLSGTADGRLLTHIVYGVLRLRGHLDWILIKLCHGNWKKTDENIKNILRTGLFQLKFSDRLPAFAVVDEAVKIARVINPAKSGLVNAVLRNYLRHSDRINFPSREEKPAEFIAAFYSHPLWLTKIWLSLFGLLNTEALCAANNEMPPLTVRVNTLKISPDELREKLKHAGFDPAPTSFSSDGLLLHSSPSPIQKTDFFQKGFLRIQDEASQLISHLVCPKSRESFLDVCSGTGGKTTHLAAILKNTGKILALDYDLNKLEELEKDAKRLGITIIKTRQADLTERLPESLTEKFDYVLIDAPCSGSGTLRRNPEIKWRIQAADLAEIAKIQNTILHNAAFAVRKGGHLIYCTCSLLPRENENVINSFLRFNPVFSVCPPPPFISPRLIDSGGFFRTFPPWHNMDGFFAAVLKRK